MLMLHGWVGINSSTVSKCISHRHCSGYGFDVKCDIAAGDADDDDGNLISCCTSVKFIRFSCRHHNNAYSSLMIHHVGLLASTSDDTRDRHYISAISVADRKLQGYTK